MRKRQVEVPAPLYKAYRELRQRADSAFIAFKYKNNHGAIACRPGCVDCCHAIFGLFPIEAFIVHNVYRALPQKLKKEIVDRAEILLEKLRFIQELDRKSDFSVSDRVERLKLRCPFLNESGLCAIYEDRPITCRVYGIPVLFKGSIHHCHKTATTKQNAFFDLDIVNHNLYTLSLGLLNSLKVNNNEKAKLILSVPIAILNPLAPILETEDSGRKTFKIVNE